MSSFDYHLLHAVANGINYFKNNRAAFDSLMEGSPQQYRDKMFNFLTTTEVNYDVTSLKRNAKLPTITAYTKSEGINNMQPLSDIGDGGYVLHEVNYGTVFIYMDSKEKLRLYELITKASIMMFRTTFLRSGYDNIAFLRSSDADLEGSSKDRNDGSYGGDNTLGREYLFKKELAYQSLSLIKVKPILPADIEYPWEITIDLI